MQGTYKKHEEVIRGRLSEIAKAITLNGKVKGEMVLVIEGAETGQADEENKWLSVSLNEHMDYYLSQGIEKKEAMKLVAKDRGITKREVYSLYMKKT